MVSATDAALPGQSLNFDLDCADATMLDKKLIQGKILLCNWSGQTTFVGSVGEASRITAKATGAVGVVILTSLQYYDSTSPTMWNFKDFPGIILWGKQFMVNDLLTLLSRE